MAMQTMIFYCIGKLKFCVISRFFLFCNFVLFHEFFDYFLVQVQVMLTAQEMKKVCLKQLPVLFHSLWKIP